jgi:hypothetical protein
MEKLQKSELRIEYEKCGRVRAIKSVKGWRAGGCIMNE